MPSKSLYLNEFDQILRKYKVSEWNLPQKMFSWDISKVTDFVFDAYSSLREEPNKSNSVFTFAANITLSGGSFPCSALKCRFDNLDSLSRFAALYADRVYVANPFEKYVFNPEIVEPRLPSLIDDVVAFLYSRPLFDAGLFSVRNNVSGFGDICLEYIDSLAIGIRKKIRKAEKQLCTRYLDDVKFEINNWGDEIFLSVSGSENLIEHGTVDIVRGLPKNLVDKYEKGSPRRLTKKEIKDNGLFRQFVLPVLADLFELNLHVVTRKTNYLSNRNLDFELMSQIGNASTLWHK